MVVVVVVYVVGVKRGAGPMHIRAEDLGDEYASAMQSEPLNPKP